MKMRFIYSHRNIENMSQTLTSRVPENAILNAALQSLLKTRWNVWRNSEVLKLSPSTM